MIKEIVIMFSGLITFIFGMAIVTTRLPLYTDYNRWVVGIGCAVLGATCVYFSGVFQEAFAKKVVKKEGKI